MAGSRIIMARKGSKAWRQELSKMPSKRQKAFLDALYRQKVQTVLSEAPSAPSDDDDSDLIDALK